MGQLRTTTEHTLHLYTRGLQDYCHKEKALPHVLLMIFTCSCQCSWPHWYKCENSALLQALQAGEPKKEKH